MKCVILAAGRGTRMRPLTYFRPKPLVPVAGKPILSWICDVLPPEIDEIVLVVGYLGEQIRKFCGDEFHERPVTYVEQRDQFGTLHALAQCRPHLGEDPFLVLPADDLQSATALAEGIRRGLSILAAPHDHPENFGVIALREDGFLREVVEKPAHPETNLVSTGAMVLDGRIFSYAVEEDSKSGEYYIPHALNRFARDASVAVVRTDFWMPIGRPEDIASVEASGVLCEH